MGMTMNVQLSENLFGNSGHLGTATLSQSMFSAYDSTQAMRPDSDFSSSPMQQSLYDDLQAPAPGDFERTLNQRIDSLEQRERTPAEENPDPSPRADIAGRSDDSPIYRNEGPQEARRSDPAPAADETLGPEKASLGQDKATTESGEARSAKTTRKESVSQPREGAESQTPKGPLETKTLVDLPAQAVMMVTEKSSQTRATQVKSNPGEAVGNSAETSDKISLLMSPRSREQGPGRRGVLNSEMALKQRPHELASDPSTQGPVKTQIKTPLLSPVSKSAVQVSDAGQSAPKEVAAEVLSASKIQAGEMPQSAKASFSSSVEVSTAQTRPGAAVSEMNLKDGSGQGAQDEKEMLRPGEGTKPAMAQTQAGSTGSGRIDLEALKLQTLATPQRVAAHAKQQTDEVRATNKTQSSEGLDDLSLRRSQASGGRAESAQQSLSGKRSKFAPSLTPTAPTAATAPVHTLETGSKQTSVMPKIGTAATPSSVLVSLPGDTPLSETPLSETPLTRAAPVKGTDAQLEALSTKDSSASVSKQIMESIHSSVQQGQKRLTIALHPAELGRVVVKLEEENGSLSGLLEVSQKQTRAEIERALPGILQSLRSSGVQIKRLDVTLDNNGNDSGSRNPAWNEPSSDSSSSHQSRQGRQGHQDTASQGPSDFAEEGFAGASRTPGYEQTPRPDFAGSASIDLLV